MKYIELLGLPGSGKSSLLKVLASSRRSKEGVTFPSEGGFTFSRRIGFRFAARQRLSNQNSVSSRNQIVRTLLDGWGADILSTFPELMSRVCQELALTQDIGREREIVFNYWRTRLAVYSHITQGSSSSWGIVDEGLSQTVMSTLVRKRINPNNAENTFSDDVQSLMALLPRDRRVVFLEASPEIVRSRIKSNSWYSEEQLDIRARVLQDIVQTIPGQSSSLLTLDACLDTASQAEHVLTWLAPEKRNGRFF